VRAAGQRWRAWRGRNKAEYRLWQRRAHAGWASHRRRRQQQTTNQRRNQRRMDGALFCAERSAGWRISPVPPCDIMVWRRRWRRTFATDFTCFMPAAPAWLMYIAIRDMRLGGCNRAPVDEQHNSITHSSSGIWLAPYLPGSNRAATTLGGINLLVSRGGAPGASTTTNSAPWRTTIARNAVASRVRRHRDACTHRADQTGLLVFLCASTLATIMTLSGLRVCHLPPPVSAHNSRCLLDSRY